MANGSGRANATPDLYDAMQNARTRRDHNESEYGAQPGTVTGSPVPGITDPAEIRGTVSMSQRRSSRAHIVD
jgi:hypothetical protein